VQFWFSAMTLKCRLTVNTSCCNYLEGETMARVIRPVHPGSTKRKSPRLLYNEPGETLGFTRPGLSGLRSSGGTGCRTSACGPRRPPAEKWICF
jgi:hypothetical protein